MDQGLRDLLEVFAQFGHVERRAPIGVFNRFAPTCEHFPLPYEFVIGDEFLSAHPDEFLKLLSKRSARDFRLDARLTKVGALAIRNSAYLLPDSEETREDSEWI